MLHLAGEVVKGIQREHAREAHDRLKSTVSRGNAILSVAGSVRR